MQSNLPFNMHQLLCLMAEKDASDLHITAGTPPQLRIHGDLIPLPFPALTPTDTKTLCFSVLNEKQKQAFLDTQELDLSFGVKNVARFRANLFTQRGATAGAFRLIPAKIKTFEELNLPKVIKSLADKPRGLILVTGPTGSGKSTTLAAIIDHINRSYRRHIITIEDPIEYVHESKLSIINQREVGFDTKSYSNATRYILRQDPDVVLLGELRDLESLQTALTIAETGHLVLSTLHTNNCTQTINRIIDVFPPEQQEQVRIQLSFVLEGVLAQQLIQSADAKSRVMAMEIMIPNTAIRNIIREDKIHLLYSQLQVGQKDHQMQTMNQSLYSHYQKRNITLDEALRRSSDVKELQSMMGSNPINL